jgi:hypothetical protein
VLADGERLGERGMFGGKAIGHFVKQCFSKEEILGEPAWRETRKAHGFCSGGSHESRHGNDTGSRLETTLRPSAVFDDLATKFVPEDGVAASLEPAGAPHLFGYSMI